MKIKNLEKWASFMDEDVLGDVVEELINNKEYKITDLQPLMQFLDGDKIKEIVMKMVKME